MTDLTIRDHLIIESLKQQPLTVRKLSEVLLVSPGAVYASLVKLTTLGHVKVKTTAQRRSTKMTRPCRYEP